MAKARFRFAYERRMSFTRADSIRIPARVALSRPAGRAVQQFEEFIQRKTGVSQKKRTKSKA